MSRYTPKTFAEARAIANPVERASALLKLSQEAEDRARMRKADGDKLSETQITALTEFLDEWEASADYFGDEQELMDAVRDAIDNGVLPDNFDRVFNAAYQATVEEYNNPSPSLGYDAEAFARALTELLNAIENTDYEPNTRESEKAARPVTLGTSGRLAAGQSVRKAGRVNTIQISSYTEDGTRWWSVLMNGQAEQSAQAENDPRLVEPAETRSRKFAEKLYAQARAPKRLIERDGDTGKEIEIKSDDGTGKAARPAVRKAISRGTDGQKADKALGTALTGLSNADMALSGNPEFGPIQNNLRGARDIIAQARQDIRDYEANPGNKAARPTMRKGKSHGAISNSSRVVRAAQDIFDKLMADDYFSENYSEDELADAAIEIAMRTTGTGPKTNKIVRETGNMFI